MRNVVLQTCVFLVLGCLGSLLGSSCRAGQQRVELFKVLDTSTTVSKVEYQAIPEACRQAVFQEALALLPFPVSEQRTDILRSYLRTQSDDFVLTYTLDKTIIGSKGIELIFYVTVNGKALQKRLQDLGTYYTTQEKISYSLQASGLSSEKWQEILFLEHLSGLVRENIKYPFLKLQYNQDKGGHWTGIIQGPQDNWSAQESSLPALWRQLWKHYFMLPETQMRFFQSVCVQIRWWSTSAQLQSFNRRFHDWNALVHEMNLKQVTLGSGGMQAKWEIKTMNVSGLQKKLEDVLSKLGLEMVYTVASEE
jgi:hypothetical protein